MQENSRFLLFVLSSVIGIWILVMAVNRNLFLHMDADLTVYGSTTIVNTDIGDRCGTGINPNTQIEYKLNLKGEIVYLCPQGFWPIQKVVIANTLSEQFRNSLNPGAADKVLQHYPVQPKQEQGAAANPFIKQ